MNNVAPPGLRMNNYLPYPRAAATAVEKAICKL